jgi:hypothetical protein
MKEKLLQHKKTIFLILLVVVVALGTAALLISKSQMAKQENKEQEGALTYKAISPGLTAKDDVVSILGDPLNQSESEGLTTYQFTSSVEARPHEATFKEEELTIFKEVVNLNKTATDITTKYGEATNILYQSQVAGGFALYIYPDKGIAYLGDTSGKDIVTEIWYFQPTTIEEFKTNWAADYYDSLSTEEPPEGYMY